MYKGERFNSISHLIGILVTITGAVVLVAIAFRQGDPWKLISFSIYGFSLSMLYTISTLYHSMRGKTKIIFRKLDHIAIYLLIAGTYTPFTLVTLRGAWGWSIFGVIWGLAMVGIIIEFLPGGERRILPVIIYLVMGWLCIVAIKPLLKAMPFAGFLWLLSGGIFYTVGVIFYALSDRVRHSHGLWHLFVLAGSVCQYFAIFFYVA